MSNDDENKELVKNLMDGSDELETGLINNLKHTDISQLEEMLDHVKPESLADRIVNYISKPEKYLNVKMEPPSIAVMVGEVLDKLSVIRSRTKIIDEKLSGDQILDNKRLMALTKEEIGKVFRETHPEVTQIATQSDDTPVFQTQGGDYRLKKTLKKKYKRY